MFWNSPLLNDVSDEVQFIAWALNTAVPGSTGPDPGLIDTLGVATGPAEPVQYRRQMQGGTGKHLNIPRGKTARAQRRRPSLR